MESEAQQSTLSAVADAIADVEERLAGEFPVLDDPDPAGLLDDEESSAAVTGVADEDRRIEPRRNRLEGDPHGRQVPGRAGGTPR